MTSSRSPLRKGTHAKTPRPAPSSVDFLRQKRLSSSFISMLALEDRQIMGRHRESDDGDRRLVNRADLAAVGCGPAAIGVLAAGGHEVLDQPAVPVFPVLAADLVHGMGGVVVAVVE